MQDIAGKTTIITGASSRPYVAQDELERRFREKFGHVRCDELLRTRFACGEFVIEAARLTDEYLDATA